MTRRLGEWLTRSLVVFAIAVAVNYAWELAQSPLYVGHDDLRFVVWHCLRAALGDGVLVLLIVAGGIMVTRRPDWYLQPGKRGYVWMLSAGLVIAVVVEWLAVHVAGRWAYGPRMPLLPGVQIGIVPILQMLVLPPVVFRIVSVVQRCLLRGA